MYGQFEQVVDRFNSHPQTDTKEMMMERFEMSDHYSSDSESSSELSSDHPPVLTHRKKTAGRMNPLLETISVIEFDSDDGGIGGTRALYTGSVDSGYKSSAASCCPTPDTTPSTAVELDLDHLTSLRQTLLTAIERYDSRTKELLRPRSSTPPPPPPPLPPPPHHNRSFRLTRPAASDRVHRLQQQPDDDGNWTCFSYGILLLFERIMGDPLTNGRGVIKKNFLRPWFTTFQSSLGPLFF